MTAYCVRCRHKTGDHNAHATTTKNGRKMMKSTCATCGGKKSMFLAGSGIRGMNVSGYKPQAMRGGGVRRKSTTKKHRRGGDLKDTLGGIMGIATKILPMFL